MESQSTVRQTLSKSERLCGKSNVSRLLENARYGYGSALKYCFTSESGEDCNRILVSVPKRNFKRAVKRNLLKRRIRESYRRQKDILKGLCGVDIMFIYNSKEILDYDTIYASVGEILTEISKKLENNE